MVCVVAFWLSTVLPRDHPVGYRGWLCGLAFHLPWHVADCKVYAEPGCVRAWWSWTLLGGVYFSLTTEDGHERSWLIIGLDAQVLTSTLRT